MTTTTKSLIETAEIHIISGEGEIGTRKVYTGKRTERAIKARLTRERCHGDRWAWAQAYSHTNEHGAVGVDVLTGEAGVWHDAK
jgi:hypothetical protein